MIPLTSIFSATARTAVASIGLLLICEQSLPAQSPPKVQSKQKNNNALPQFPILEHLYPSKDPTNTEDQTKLVASALKVVFGTKTENNEDDLELRKAFHISKLLYRIHNPKGTTVDLEGNINTILPDQKKDSKPQPANDGNQKKTEKEQKEALDLEFKKAEMPKKEQISKFIPGQISQDTTSPLEVYAWSSWKDLAGENEAIAFQSARAWLLTKSMVSGRVESDKKELGDSILKLLRDDQSKNKQNELKDSVLLYLRALPGKDDFKDLIYHAIEPRFSSNDLEKLHSILKGLDLDMDDNIPVDTKSQISQSTKLLDSLNDRVVEIIDESLKVGELKEKVFTTHNTPGNSDGAAGIAEQDKNSQRKAEQDQEERRLDAQKTEHSQRKAAQDQEERRLDAQKTEHSQRKAAQDEEERRLDAQKTEYSRSRAAQGVEEKRLNGKQTQAEPSFIMLWIAGFAISSLAFASLWALQLKNTQKLKSSQDKLIAETNESKRRVAELESHSEQQDKRIKNSNDEIKRFTEKDGVSQKTISDLQHKVQGFGRGQTRPGGSSATLLSFPPDPNPSRLDQGLVDENQRLKTENEKLNTDITILSDEVQKLRAEARKYLEEAKAQQDLFDEYEQKERELRAAWERAFLDAHADEARETTNQLGILRSQIEEQEAAQRSLHDNLVRQKAEAERVAADFESKLAQAAEKENELNGKVLGQASQIQDLSAQIQFLEQAEINLLPEVFTSDLPLTGFLVDQAKVSNVGRLLISRLQVTKSLMMELSSGSMGQARLDAERDKLADELRHISRQSEALIKMLAFPMADADRFRELMSATLNTWLKNHEKHANPMRLEAPTVPSRFDGVRMVSRAGNGDLVVALQSWMVWGADSSRPRFQAEVET